MLNRALLKQELSLRCPAAEEIHLCLYDCIDSTNTEAKRMAADAKAPMTLLAADAQSAGRGRMGRSFYSPSATGVYFSLLYTAQAPMTSAVTVTSAAAVAVMRAVERLCGIRCSIKWVNDLYLENKKIAGILAESVSCGEQHSIVLGIGINLTTESFPEDLSFVAGSLGKELPMTREALIAEIFSQLYPYIQDATDASWLSDYRASSMVLGKRIRWSDPKGGFLEGTAEDIAPSGALIAKDDAGCLYTLSTGEITLRLC